MKPLRITLFALISMCVSLPILAQDTFTNNDGMFTGTSQTSGDLSLGNSMLTGISGFTGSLAGYNTAVTPPASLGTLSFTTGTLLSTMAGTTTLPLSMVPLTGQTDTFGAGGMYKVKDTFNGGYGGFTFKGTFASGATWTCSGTCTQTTAGANATWSGVWTFIGSLTGATLTVAGQTFTAMGPLTIQSTTATNGTATKGGTGGPISFTDQSGFTNFGGNFQVSPEPGTLTLFGSGFIALGLLTKYGRSRKLTNSDSTGS